jgi:hypothetical protein
MGYRVYDVTSGFGITGPGQYSIEERGDADVNLRSPEIDVAGEQIVVVFDDPRHSQVRHISYQPRYIKPQSQQYVSLDVTKLPTCGNPPTNAVIAFSETGECSDEQDSVLEFKPGNATSFTTLTTVLGGRDDGTPGVTGGCFSQDWTRSSLPARSATTTTAAWSGSPATARTPNPPTALRTTAACPTSCFRLARSISRASSMFATAATATRS